jgi:hypothetical protein
MGFAPEEVLTNRRVSGVLESTLGNRDDDSKDPGGANEARNIGRSFNDCKIHW